MTAERLTLRQWIRDHDESWIFVAIYLGLAVGLSVFVSLFWLVVVAGLHLLLELLRQSHYRDGSRDVFLHALWEVKLDVGLVLLALMLVLYIDIVLGLLGLQSAARAAAVTRAGARIGTRAAAWERNLRTFLLTVDEMVRIAHAGVMLRRKRGSGGTEAGPSTEPSATGPTSEGEDEPSAGPEAEAEEWVEASEPETAQEGGDRAPAGPEAGPQEQLGPEEGEPETGGAALSVAADASPDAEASPEPDPSLALAPSPAPDPLWRAPWGIGDHIGVALVAVGMLLIVAAPFATEHTVGSALGALLEELRPFPD
jgi:hypothetical protein